MIELWTHANYAQDHDIIKNTMVKSFQQSKLMFSYFMLYCKQPNASTEVITLKDAMHTGIWNRTWFITHSVSYRFSKYTQCSTQVIGLVGLGLVRAWTIALLSLMLLRYSCLLSIHSFGRVALFFDWEVFIVLHTLCPCCAIQCHFSKVWEAVQSVE